MVCGDDPVEWCGDHGTVWWADNGFLLTRFHRLRIARNAFAATSLACAAVCFIAIPFVDSAVAVIALMTLGNAFNALVNNIYWPVVIDVTPKSSVGTFSGITLAIANSSAILSPVLCGWLAQYYGYNTMFLVTGAFAIVSMCAMAVIQPEKRLHDDETISGTTVVSTQ